MTTLITGRVQWVKDDELSGLRGEIVYKLQPTSLPLRETGVADAPAPVGPCQISGRSQVELEPGNSVLILRSNGTYEGHIEGPVTAYDVTLACRAATTVVPNASFTMQIELKGTIAGSRMADDMPEYKYGDFAFNASWDFLGFSESKDN
jgi:hypothetical protein